MAKVINFPSIIQSAGNKPKQIEEYFGRVNSLDENVSIAKMISSAGWIEPGQTPEFDEYTIVLNGTLQVKTREEVFKISAGQAVAAFKGEWVQYSTPDEGGAEYIAVCIPAFSPSLVHRDGE